MAYRKLCVLAFAVFLLPVHQAFSDANGAQTAYMQGMKWEKAKKYSWAIYEYQAALRADANYFWANRELGNCYYYLGDREKAMDAYDRYLRANPRDEAMKRYVDHLKGSGAASSDNSKLAAGAMQFGLGLGYSLYSMSDWNSAMATVQSDLAAEGVNASGGQINGGLDFALDFKYYFNDRWDAGLKFDYMTAGGTLSADGGSDNFSFPAIFFGAQGDYTFYKYGEHLRVHGGAALGLLTLMGATESISSSYGSASDGFSGSGIGLEARVGADWFLNRNLSITGVLGYRYASISQITSSDNDAGTSPDLDSGGLDYSGPFITVGIAYWK